MESKSGSNPEQGFAVWNSAENSPFPSLQILMTENFPKYDRLPEQMQSAAKMYIEEGRLHSDFLRAVLENDLVESYGRADLTNQSAMKEWTMWLFNDVPANCWGDEETVEKWCESGGLNGQTKEEMEQ